MVPVWLLHAHEIGEGLFPVGLPVIRAGAVEARVDQDGEAFWGWHEEGYWKANEFWLRTPSLIVDTTKLSGGRWIIGQNINSPQYFLLF